MFGLYRSGCPTTPECEQCDVVFQAWKLERSNDSAAKLIPTSTQWLTAFPEAGRCWCVRVCAAAEVIISGGCGGLSVPFGPPQPAKPPLPEHTSSVIPSQTSLSQASVYLQGGSALIFSFLGLERAGQEWRPAGRCCCSCRSGDPGGGGSAEGADCSPYQRTENAAGRRKWLVRLSCLWTAIFEVVLGSRPAELRTRRAALKESRTENAGERSRWRIPPWDEWVPAEVRRQTMLPPSLTGVRLWATLSIQRNQLGSFYTEKVQFHSKHQNYSVSR